MGVRRLTAVLLGLVLLVSAACAHASPSVAHGATARIGISPRTVMADDAFHVAVSRLPHRSLVELQLELRTPSATWVSRATFRADERGRVDVASDAPVSGAYRGVDPMGLVWSASPDGATPNPAVANLTDDVHISASVDGRIVASKGIVRHYLRPGTRVIKVQEHGLVGTLFEPEARKNLPTLIVVGGSEGGIGYAAVTGALLSTHRFNVLALAYFEGPGVQGMGLPKALSRIPLEYFGTAIDWLRSRGELDANRIGIVGGSRGAELALLLATRYPALRAVVAYAPSSVVWPGWGGPQDPQAGLDSAWSERGQSIPFLTGDPSDPHGAFANVFDDTAAREKAAIPVERINGPVLLITGDEDQIWPSSGMAKQIMRRLRAAGHPFADQHLSYAGAGHGIRPPFEPTTPQPSSEQLGGNPRDSAYANRDHWPRMLTFLATAL